MTYDEARALLLGNDPVKLENRLRSARRKLVPRDIEFEPSRFDFRSRRLVSRCGRWQLTWHPQRGDGQVMKDGFVIFSETSNETNDLQERQRVSARHGEASERHAMPDDNMARYLAG